MLIPIITAFVLAASATFDGYYSYRAQLIGADETGPSRIIYGAHPTKNDFIFKGGAIILVEIALSLMASYHYRQLWASLVFSAPLLTQSVFHIFGGLSGKKISDFGGWTAAKILNLGK